jgi:hypothetical protein
MAEVVLVGGAIGVPALSKNNDVRGAAERIGVDGARAQVDIGVVTRGLVGRGAIEVPDREVFRLVVLLGESSGLGSGTTISVDPDVLSHNLTLLVELEILLESLRP